MEATILHPTDDDLDAVQLAAALNVCPNLRELTILDMVPQNMRDIFAGPKEHLRELRILNSTWEHDELEELMGLISASTKRVETFQYSASEGVVRSPLDAFDKFMDRNSPTLRSISILN